MPNPHLRPSNSVPDPNESVIMSARPVFKWNMADVPWLPDSSGAMNMPEVDLDSDDEFDPMTLGKCPSDALHPEDQPVDPARRDALIAAASSAKAAWIFGAYKALVEHRIKVYNK